MKLSQKLRKIWHEYFYKDASSGRYEFALKCQDVTAGIDLKEKPTNLSGQFRFWLHLSLCQACKNYYDLSQVLSKALNQTPARPSPNIDSINQSLLEKYGR